MMADRLRQRAEQFFQAFSRLKSACDQSENEFIRDAVIQRFEFTFELAWKLLKIRLLEEGIEVNSPRAVIREAVAAGLLEDGNLWSEMLHKRNLTSHTYDEALAQQVYAFICTHAHSAFARLAEQARQWIN